MHKFIAALFLIHSLTPAAFAEETSASPRPDPVHWKKDRILQEFISPWTEARPYLLVGTGLVLTLLAFEDDLIYGTQKSISTRKPLGKFSSIGDYSGQLIPNALYAGGMYFFGKQDNAMLMIKASLYSSAVTTVLKYSINQKRPDSSNRHSFPSGHSTTAFAFASTVAALHEWYWGAAAYALASYVGFSRINDNKHYAHDVVAGATIGAVYGVGVAAIHKKYISARYSKEKTSEKQARRLEVMPVVDQDLLGISLNYEF